jgi:PTH1 family peptidyl-tRNA hydrolase
MPHTFRLIVGLGNPGREYRETRHNAGFWWIERLAETSQAAFHSESKFQARVAATRGSDGDIRLAMPQTFMNRSGLAVASLARIYRIAPAEILVAHEELDLKPGVVKLKQGGGNAGHNGLKDITAALGSGDFWRLRLGIGHPRDGALSEQEVADYVLHPPPGEERLLIADAIARALAIWPWLARGETERAMHELHTAPRPPSASEGPASS